MYRVHKKCTFFNVSISVSISHHQDDLALVNRLSLAECKLRSDYDFFAITTLNSRQLQSFSQLLSVMIYA